MHLNNWKTLRNYSMWTPNMKQRREQEKKKKGPTDFLPALVEVQIFLTCIYFKPLLTNAAGAAVHAKDTKLTMNIAQSCTTTTTHGSSTLLRSWPNLSQKLSISSRVYYNQPNLRLAKLWLLYPTDQLDLHIVEKSCSPSSSWSQ